MKLDIYDMRICRGTKKCAICIQSFIAIVIFYFFFNTSSILHKIKQLRCMKEHISLSSEHVISSRCTQDIILRDFHCVQLYIYIRERFVHTRESTKATLVWTGARLKVPIILTSLRSRRKSERGESSSSHFTTDFHSV